MSLHKLLESMQKTSIRMTFSAIGDCPVGSSKIGGKPDLPPGFEWFYYQGKSYGGINARRPLSFLAQINCEEIHEYDKESLLPSAGVLYFFYELATMTWGFDPNDGGSARVYYHEGSVSELHRTDFPADLPEEYQFPEIPVGFLAKDDLPSYDEFLELTDRRDYDWKEYYDIAADLGFDLDEHSVTKLLGYANIIQSDMLLLCEMVTNGIYCGNADYGVTEDELHRLKENSKKWQLLFQIDSIFIDGRDIMMWGDVGRLYYYIKIEDLINRNFISSWLILQCT